MHWKFILGVTFKRNRYKRWRPNGLFYGTTKISEKLSILKSIEKISDELPEVVWRVNRYGYEIKSKKSFRKRHDILNQEDEIELEKNCQDLCVE